MSFSVKISLAITLSASIASAPAQDLDTVQAAQASPKTHLPLYVVYRHFLAWVNELDKAASAANATDTYKFAEPFARANLQHAHLDILRDRANLLNADLRKQDARAQVYISRYRAQAQNAISQGLPLPALPAELHDLELQKTALFIHHYVTLHTALGPDVSAQLDNYLSYEFAPHIKLRKMADPAPPITP